MVIDLADDRCGIVSLCKIERIVSPGNGLSDIWCSLPGICGKDSMSEVRDASGALDFGTGTRIGELWVLLEIGMFVVLDTIPISSLSVLDGNDITGAKRCWMFKFP